ncbi:MAG: hypothetical protein HYS25_08170 [Ignavibacteriales bacterium]|nr:hypothetical protein [Ignavibacteriales bacterium]
MLIKKIFFYIIFITTIFTNSTNLFAQFSVGLNFEPFVMNGDVSTQGVSILGASAAIGYQFDSTKSISLRAGIYSRDADGRFFAGSNYSLIGRFAYNNSLYGLTGLSVYVNGGTSSMSGRITNRTIALLNLGLGMKPLSWLHIENIILIPVGGREFASVVYWYSYTTHYKIDYIYKFNLGFELQF